MIQQWHIYVKLPFLATDIATYHQSLTKLAISVITVMILSSIYCCSLRSRDYPLFKLFWLDYVLNFHYEIKKLFKKLGMYWMATNLNVDLKLGIIRLSFNHNF